MEMRILDPCSGSRMMYFDKQDHRVLFGDIREEEHYLKDRESIRHLEVKPDIKMDFEQKLDDRAAVEVLKELRQNGFDLKYFQYDGSQFSDYGMEISWVKNAPAAK